MQSETDPSPVEDQQARRKTPAILQSSLLFVNFFLIITALYQMKPASRSQILEVLRADNLPYVWIGSALAIFIFINIYNRILRRVSRVRVVLGSALLVMVCLVAFRFALMGHGPVASVLFYVFVDLVGVTLVEQFWSLANSIYSTKDGKNWYGMVGTGGLIGGMTGSALGAYLIHYTPLQTPDLLLVAAFIVGLIFAITLWMHHLQLYGDLKQSSPITHTSWPYQNGRQHRNYLLLIAAALLMAQLISPLVEFQFMKIVETSFPEREVRTATLSLFFSVLSGFSIFVNLLVTPIVLKRLGVLAGLLIQPFLLAVSAGVFNLYGGFLAGAAMKIADRGLSYSITRASKELLYIPVDKLVMYQAKAWIDMFGYRTFKIVGAVTILVLTQWTNLATNGFNLNGVIILSSAVWIGLLVVLSRRYQALDSDRSLPVQGQSKS